MNHRAQTAHVIASNAVVLVYRQPRAVMPYRATAVVELPDGQYGRVTAPGFTTAAAERRCRRAILRELLLGWWQ